MENGNPSPGTAGNRASLAFFMKRSLILWLIVIVCYWFDSGALFNDLLENQRLVFFREPGQQAAWALVADLLLGLSLLSYCFLPRYKWTLLPAVALLPCLLFVMATGGRAIYASPLAWWILVWLLASSEKNALRLWKWIRFLAIGGTVLYGLFLGTQMKTAELIYFSDFQKPEAIYFIFIFFGIGFFTRKADGIFLVVLAGFATLHSITYGQPLLPKTLIFAPFLNWTNLHRFFTRFEPK